MEVKRLPVDKKPWVGTTIMPWGEHKGTPLEDVPGDYLYGLLMEKWIADYPGLHAYLKRHRDVISEQALDAEKTRGDAGGYDSYEDYIRDKRD